MTGNITIRFTEPIDPRDVWDFVVGQVCPGGEYQWDELIASEEPGHWRNPGRRGVPNQGAKAIARMSYGKEGSLLRAEDEDGEIHDPTAYVEIDLDYGWDNDTVVRQIVSRIRDWSPVPTVWTNRMDGWST